MATFRDLLSAAKAQITEVDTAAAAEHIAKGALVLDVREPDEYDQGALPDAVHIPRGHLEAQVEGKLLDKHAQVVVYCAGGVRSAFAAKTMAELGYTDVLSVAGGFGKWKDEGRPWKTPLTLTAEQRTGDFSRLADARGNAIPIYDPQTTAANTAYKIAPVRPGLRHMGGPRQPV